MFPEIADYTDETMKLAVGAVREFDANMGGTEIYSPLKEIFAHPQKKGMTRHVFLLTDGAVFNPQEVIDLIKDGCHSATLHAFGVGSGASTELVKGAARAGRGKHYFIADK